MSRKQKTSTTSTQAFARASAHVNQGKAMIGLRRYEAALANFEQALAIDPRFLEAHQLRGGVLFRLGRYEVALASFDKAVALEPRFVHGWIGRGSALLRLRRLEDARASFARAVELAPAQAETHYNLGCALNELKQFDSAAASFDKAIVLNPRYLEAYNNKAVALAALGRFDDALACHDVTIQLNPSLPDSRVNLGVTLQMLGRHLAAKESYEKAVAVAPDNARAHWNLALCCLLTGDLERGWQHFEWRWRYRGGADAGFSRPRWSGAESLVGQTILLHAEQGLGDTLQFCRYAESVAELGARVVLRVPQPLVRVLSTLRGVAQVIDEDAVLPECDFQCPLMSLPLVFKTALGTLPANIPYLHADAEKRAAWRERLGARTGLRVGLVWSGGLRPDQPDTWEVNRRRNVPLEKLAPLDLPGVAFFSLQKGDDAVAQLRQLEAAAWDGPHIEDSAAEFADFVDTAACVDNLDLVISVDTSTAHLAAAMGKEVWLLNRFDTCWRWLLDRSDSPWYPGLRLFRQRAPGDWEGVVADVREALRERLAAGAADSIPSARS